MQRQLLSLVTFIQTIKGREKKKREKNNVCFYTFYSELEKKENSEPRGYSKKGGKTKIPVNNHD